MVREFKLINEKGAEYSLMDIENYCLLTEPSGLGYSYDTDYIQLGNSFFTNLRKINQGRINGIVNCNHYDNFKKLIDFIENSEELKICYAIPFKNSKKNYYKDIQISSLDKSEKGNDGIIKEPIVFDCLSLWYTKQQSSYDISTGDDEICWDFTWDSRFVAFSSRSLQLINDGHVDAPVEIEIDGEAVNPQIELYVEGELYQTITFSTTIDEYEKLLYGTKENQFYILKEEVDGSKTNLKNITVIDFYNDNVLRVPKNKSCEIRLSADNDISSARVNVFIYYVAI